MNTFPIFIATIDDDMDGVTAVSLVEQGAVDVDFQLFDKNKPMEQFAIQNEEQHLLLGCIMRCDYNIYRRNADGFEYFIRYERDTIEKMASKMLKDFSFNQIDLQHDGNMLPKGCVELRELFIKDSSKGITPKGFEDVNDGSLFAVYKVNDETIWELCRQGIFNSFSLEGYFSVKEQEMYSKVDEEGEILSLIAKLGEKIKHKA